MRNKVGKIGGTFRQIYISINNTWNWN